jgi:hypothetical protein
VANLLWTGGWDSSFRLLDLVVRKKRPVQPYYVLNADRRSSSLEMERMDQIRDELAHRFPDSRRLLLPTAIVSRSELRPAPEITAAMARLKQKTEPDPLGTQYEYLARFVSQAGLTDLELAVHQDDRAHRILETSIVAEEEGRTRYYRLVDRPDDPDLLMFQSFRFPILDLTKLEMRDMARDWGLLDILEMTWFCHKPRRNRPCGLCPSCRSTCSEGMRYRLPLWARSKYLIYVALRSAMPASMWNALRAWKRTHDRLDYASR